MAQQESLGTVSGLFRYPVKSLRGEALAAADIFTSGMAGDRLWALRDVARGEITSGKRSPRLMQISASLMEDGLEPQAKISLPGGESFLTSDPDCSAKISGFAGRQMSLCELRPASDAEHFARAKVDPANYEAEVREMLALLPDEPFPDFSKLPPEALMNTTLPGTYFDVSTVSIVLASELRQLHDSLPDAGVDAMRFRPNIVLNDLESPLTSEALVGVRMKIGAVELVADSHAPRCSMTTHAQGALPKAPQIMRTLVRDWKHNFGLYVSVLKGGHIQKGDIVTRL